MGSYCPDGIYVTERVSCPLCPRITLTPDPKEAPMRPDAPSDPFRRPNISLRARVQRGTTGLTPLQILIACRAVLMAANLATAGSIRGMGLREAMVSVPAVPKVEAARMFQASLDISLPAAGRLYDACVALGEAVAVTLLIDPDAASSRISVEAQVGTY